MGKGEIARYEQFLLFPQCFQRACSPGASKGVIVWEWVNTLLDDPEFIQCGWEGLLETEKREKDAGKQFVDHTYIIICKYLQFQ